MMRASSSSRFHMNSRDFNSSSIIRLSTLSLIAISRAMDCGLPIPQRDFRSRLTRISNASGEPSLSIRCAASLIVVSPAPAMC